jgi:hypothetical protein
VVMGHDDARRAEGDGEPEHPGSRNADRYTRSHPSTHWASGLGARVFQVRRKPKQPKTEVHATIVKDAKMRLGCGDFAPDFTPL